MLIGVDFDNTIVCYDELFRRLALERGLVPADTPASKGAVRDCLRRAGLEEIWTELQGEVYGARMLEAQPFPGVLEFFQRCRQQKVPTVIISHRTRQPYRGSPHDLHQAARDWLAAFGFHEQAGIALATAQVFLELTKSDKLARIASVGCSHFIDDLPELLAESTFPIGVRKILFNPNGMHSEGPGVHRLCSWPAIEQFLLFGEG